MSHDPDHRANERLRAFFEEVHREDPAPPPFQRAWRGEGSRSGRPLSTLRLALAGGLAAAVLGSALWLALPHGNRPNPATVDIALAGWPVEGPAEWPIEWHGPLDFLLETPGQIYLDTLPQVPGEATALWPGGDLAFIEETDP